MNDHQHQLRFLLRRQVVQASPIHHVKRRTTPAPFVSLYCFMLGDRTPQVYTMGLN